MASTFLQGKSVPFLFLLGKDRMIPEDAVTTTILFFRHGSTDFPEDMVYSENAGPGLNREGIIQAENLGRWAVQGINAIYTSPSQRTMETAQAIAAAINVSPIIDDSLRERSLGIWEGLSLKEVASIYPEDYSLWEDGNPTFAPSKGESITDLATRVKRAINMILEKHKGRKIGVVTHAGPIRASVLDVLSSPLSSFRRISISYGSVTKISYNLFPTVLYLSRLP